MALAFKDLQDEVKRRALRNQAGTEYDEEIKNLINASLLRLSREAKWRCLRRKATFDTVSSYTSGTGYMSVTQSSTSFTISDTAASFWQDKVEINRYIEFGTGDWYYKVTALNSNTVGTLNIAYRGTTSTATTYEIFPQTIYNLPVQVDHRAFLWHEDYGYPYRMEFIPTRPFIDSNNNLVEKGTPQAYTMWGEDCVRAQVPTATPITVTLSSSTDSGVQVVISGRVAGYPLTETIGFGASGTTTNSAYEFESVERISKDSGTTGTITFTSSQGGYTLAVLPAGDTTATLKYSKVEVFPMPNRVFPVNVYYYKDPYRLVNDDDVHEMGQEFDEAIIMLCVAKLKLQDSQPDGDRWYQMYNDEVRNLRKDNIDKIDWFPTLQRPYNSGSPRVHKNLLYRQAGGYYGPSSRR